MYLREKKMTFCIVPPIG